MTTDPTPAEAHAESEHVHTHGHTIHWARGYDLLLSVATLGREGRFRRRIVEHAGISAGDRVLDVGCGTGTTALVAARRVGPVGEVVGVDPSSEMIERARRKAERAQADLRFESAAIESLPFPDAHFDVAVSSLVFHHLTGAIQLAGLRELRRVLVPGGRLVIVDFRGEAPLFHRLLEQNSPDNVLGFARLEADAREAGFASVRSSGFRPRFLGVLDATTPTTTPTTRTTAPACDA